MEGATYYKIYYDQFLAECSIDQASGRPNPCEALATDIVETSYIHTDPNAFRNYYWVVACNSDGCSTIDSDNPAEVWSG